MLNHNKLSCYCIYFVQYSTTAIDCQDHISSACLLSLSRVVKEVFLCRWCADFEEKGRHRVLRIMLALTLVILPVTVFSIGAVKFGSSQQKSLPHIPRAGNHISLHPICVFFFLSKVQEFLNNLSKLMFIV